MTDKLLELVRLCIQSGENENALNILTGLLRADQNCVPAWELMALLQEDPRKRADCYQQILRLEPGHQIAKDSLTALSGESDHLPPPEVQQVLDLLRTLGLGAFDEYTYERFRKLGVEITVVDNYVTVSSGTREVKIHTSTLPQGREELYTDEVLVSAGGPLSPDDCMECPYCKAVVPRISTRCVWCSAELKS